MDGDDGADDDEGTDDEPSLDDADGGAGGDDEDGDANEDTGMAEQEDGDAKLPAPKRAKQAKHAKTGAHQQALEMGTATMAGGMTSCLRQSMPSTPRQVRSLARPALGTCNADGGCPVILLVAGRVVRCCCRLWRACAARFVLKQHPWRPHSASRGSCTPPDEGSGAAPDEANVQRLTRQSSSV